MNLSILSSDIWQKIWGAVGSLPGFGRVTISALSISVGKDEKEATLL